MRSDDAVHYYRTTRSVRIVLWCGVGLLVTIGMVAALGRGLFVADFATRAEPFRQQLLHALNLADPNALDRAAEVHHFDSPFAAHPLLTLLHVLPGGILLMLAPLQFSSRLRGRHIRFHRLIGRVLVLAGLTAGLTALYFGLLMPYGGRIESLAIALFGGLFLVALSRAFVAIRRHQVASHREWMIRAFAIGLGVSTVRLVDAVLDLTFRGSGLGPREIFVLAIWTGWVMTLGGAELWIRHTRRPTGPEARPTSAAELASAPPAQPRLL